MTIMCHGENPFYNCIILHINTIYIYIDMHLNTVTGIYKTINNYMLGKHRVFLSQFIYIGCCFKRIEVPNEF